MFGKNSKKENISNTFGDKGYMMKPIYNADELFVAKLQRTTTDTDLGPMSETTKQKYIFEIIIDEGKTKYREIFTGFIAECVKDTIGNGCNFKYFYLPYVYNPEKFTDYLPETIGIEMPKLSLIWAQNDINYSNVKLKKNMK